MSGNPPAQDAASQTPDARRVEWERAADDVAIDQLDIARRLIGESNWGAASKILRSLIRSSDAEVASAARALLARLRPDGMAWGFLIAALLLLAVVLRAVY